MTAGQAKRVRADHTLWRSALLTLGKVVRDVITNGFGGTGAVAGGMTGTEGGQRQTQICPMRRSTGFYPGGDLSIPAPRPGLIPGTFIGPTLVFPGVLNPGIPTTLPPTNPIVNATGTQIQIAPSGAQTFGTGTSMGGSSTTGPGTITG